MKENIQPKCSLSDVVSGHTLRRIFVAAIGIAAFVLAGPMSAQAQLAAQPTRLTVQSGASGTITNIVISFNVDTNETVELTVSTNGVTGITGYTLTPTNVFSAPTNAELDTNIVLTVSYNGTVPQAGPNDIVITATNDFNYRLPLPLHATYIWDGATNDNAWLGNWLPGNPGSSDIVNFTSVGAAPAIDDDEASPGFFTNLVTNVVISSDQTVSGLRFSHGAGTEGPPDPDSSYRVEIKPGVTLSVTGTNGFTMLRDTINNYDEMQVEFFGGGNLVLNNTNSTWSMLGETASQNDNVLNMEGLKNFTADVNRVGLGNYQVYPNWTTNGWATEPDQWVPNVNLAETNVIKTTWIGGSDVINNATNRPYAFTLGNMHSGGTSSGQQLRLLLGRTNAFFVESIVFSQSGAKGESDNRVIFNTDTNVIPTNVVPVAIFRGPAGGTNRVAVFAIADASGLGGSGSSSKGNVNLTGGKVDALVDILYVGRDRLESTDNASGQGQLQIGGDAAGSVFDVNTAYISWQGLGNNQSDPADDDDPSGEVDGTLNVGSNALFQVNGTLHLGYTTATNLDKRAAETGDGAIFISNSGKVVADNIFVGGVTKVSINNRISILGGGELEVTTTNGIGQSDKWLNTLTMSESTLTLPVDAASTTPMVYATNVATSGPFNTIKVSSLVNDGSLPAVGLQVPIIKYGAASPNFGVVFVPANRYGYVVNNTTDKTIDIVIKDTPPANLVWDGGVSTNWDLTTGNWNPGSTIFTNGDTARFDNTATSYALALSEDVFTGDFGVLFTNNDSSDYTIEDGGGALAGSGSINKWGSNTLTWNASTLLGLNLHEGTVDGDGVLGATTVDSGASLSYSGDLAKLTTSGQTELLSGGTIISGASVEEGGTLTNSGLANITTGAQILVRSNAVLHVNSGGQVRTAVPNPTYVSQIDAGGLVVMDGLWQNTTNNGPAGIYRIQMGGTWMGDGDIQGRIDYGQTPTSQENRFNITSGGVLDIGKGLGDLETNTFKGRLDYDPGSTILVDYDSDATNADGHVRSDVLFVDRVSTMRGTLRLNNVGAGYLTPGWTLRILRKPIALVNFPLSDAGQFPTIDPPAAGPGVIWLFEETAFRSNGILKTVATATNAINLNWAITSTTNITFSWPTNHLGWELQTQLRTLQQGMTNQWQVVVTPTTTTPTTNQTYTVSGTNFNLTITNWIGEAQGLRLYRLRHPEWQ